MEQNASISANTFSEAADFSVFDLEFTDDVSYLDAVRMVFQIFMCSKRTTANRHNTYSDLDYIVRKLRETAETGIITEIGRQEIMIIINRYRYAIDLETRY